VILETIAGNLYDYPKYYDLVYGSDWKAEVDFLQACFDTYATVQVKRLFEPACGTGRLLFRLAKYGYQVAGLDLNPHAVRFCNARLLRHGFKPTVLCGDMTDYQLKRPVDAAFNTINSFRHLTTQRQAIDHLQCVSRSLRKGGLYVLGLHLTPTLVEPMDEESWSARRGNLAVLSRLEVTDRDLAQRSERVGMTLDIYTPTRQFRIVDEIVFRTYTANQFDALLRQVPTLEPVAVHDFAYDIHGPVEIDEQTEDVVYVLRKK
jgi:SAM-dependent methyltransferase